MGPPNGPWAGWSSWLVSWSWPAWGSAVADYFVPESQPTSEKVEIAKQARASDLKKLFLIRNSVFCRKIVRTRSNWLHKIIIKVRSISIARNEDANANS
jgi:hypothetical protein